jgi:hypothetical protein
VVLAFVPHSRQVLRQDLLGRVVGRLRVVDPGMVHLRHAHDDVLDRHRERQEQVVLGLQRRRMLLHEDPR